MELIIDEHVDYSDEHDRPSSLFIRALYILQIPLEQR